MKTSADLVQLDPGPRLKPQCKLGSVMLMVDYRHPVNLKAFFSFCPVSTPDQVPKLGDIFCVKKGQSHRGIMLRETKGFPYGLTLDVYNGTKTINIKLWETEKPDPRTGELLCKCEICGTNEVAIAEKALELVFDKVHWLQTQLEQLQQDPELNPALDWIEQHLVPLQDLWETDKLEFDQSPPDQFRNLTDFAQRYFKDDLDPESLVAGLKWFVAQERVCKARPEVVLMWPCMFKLNFQLPFVVDYTKLRDTVNQLFMNGFQNEFFVFYIESENPNCGIHGRCDDSPDHLYIYRLGAKPKEGITNITLTSPGFNPQRSIQNFWKFMMENYRDISTE